MSDIDLMAFVSDNGYVIGIGRSKPASLEPDRGMAVAILRTQVTLVQWLDTLNNAPDLLTAVESMVDQYGGQPIAKMINMDKAAFVPLFSTDVVAEA